MHYLSKMYTSSLLNKQKENQKERIARINALMQSVHCSKSFQDSYDFFCELDEIMRDKNYKFIDYSEKDTLVENAKHVFKHIGVDYNSYLDLACGWGQFVRAAHELGIKYCCGVDLGARNEHWDYYKKNTNGCIDFFCVDFCTSGLSNKFDLITSFNAFEHFEDPERILDSIAPFLSPSGIFYTTFAPIYNSPFGMHMNRGIKIPWYHLLFSEKVIQKYYDEGEGDLRKQLTYNYLNKWSAMDFYTLFINCKDIRLRKMQPIWDVGNVYFLDIFKKHMNYSDEELCCCGFTAEFVLQNPDAHLNEEVISCTLHEKKSLTPYLASIRAKVKGEK